MAAFTVFELLIAMVLTSILVSMAFVGLGLLKKQQVVFHQGNEKMMTIRQLNNWIKIDQKNCKLLTREGNSLIYHSKTQKVKYEIASDRITRSLATSQILADTFSVSTKNWDTKFQNTNKEKGIIDRVNLEIEYGAQSYPIIIHKNYSASNLIEYKNEH